MKKFIAILMTGLLCVLLAACGGKPTNDKQVDTSATENNVTETTNNNDDKTNDKVDLSFLDEYKAPSDLTDNYADYIFRLEGNMYQLPAPVSAFVDNGWTITNATDSIAAGDQKDLLSGLKKDDFELTCIVKNFSDAAVEIKDTMIIGVILDSSFLDGIDFELSGGITFGMSSTDFTSKSYATQFTTDDAVLGDIEYSHFEPSNRIYLTFKDEKLVVASISKLTLNK